MEQIIMNPDETKVVRIISFYEKSTGAQGFVGYLRPITPEYQGDFQDKFDESFIKWLQALHLDNVHVIYAGDAICKDQLEQLDRMYKGERSNTSLSLTIHGDYIDEEMMMAGGYEARVIQLKVYWNALSGTPLLHYGDSMAFDKAEEKYFFEVVDNLESF